MMKDYTDRKAFCVLQERAHSVACSKGWWDTDRGFLECVALMHCELSEAVEAYRDGNPPDKHIPIHSSMSVELADVVIRIMDYAGRQGIDLDRVIEDKIDFNRTRSHRHGGKKA